MGKISLAVSQATFEEIRGVRKEDEEEEFKLLPFLKGKKEKGRKIKEDILTNFNCSPALARLCTSSEENMESYQGLLARLWELYEEEEVEVELNPATPSYSALGFVTIAPSLESFKKEVAEDEEEEEAPESLLFVELDNKFSLLPASNEEGERILLLHKAVQINSQREILNSVLETFKLKNDENELLAILQEKSLDLEKLVAENDVEKLTVPMASDSY